MEGLRRWIWRPGWWVLAVGVWALALYLMSSRSRLPSGPEIPHLDKVVHALYFMAGSACFAMVWRVRKSPPGWRVLLGWTLAFAMLVGALDEWHQSFVPGRSGNDLGDWLADSLGGIMGWALVRFSEPFLKPGSSARP